MVDLCQRYKVRHDNLKEKYNITKESKNEINKKWKANIKVLAYWKYYLFWQVAAGLVIGAFMVYPKVQMSQKIDKESKNITAIQAGVKSLYAGRAKTIIVEWNGFNSI